MGHTNNTVSGIISSLEWKLIGRAEGGNSINLSPYKAISKEFRFVVVYDYGNSHWKVPISLGHSDVYDDVYYQYVYGGATFGDTPGIGAGLGIEANGASIALREFYFNERIELSAATALFAFYR